MSRTRGTALSSRGWERELLFRACKSASLIKSPSCRAREYLPDTSYCDLSIRRNIPLLHENWRTPRARTSEKNGTFGRESSCVRGRWYVETSVRILPGSPLPSTTLIYSNSIDTFFQCLIGKWLALSAPNRGLSVRGITVGGEREAVKQKQGGGWRGRDRTRNPIFSRGNLRDFFWPYTYTVLFDRLISTIYSRAKRK